MLKDPIVTAIIILAIGLFAFAIINSGDPYAECTKTMSADTCIHTMK
jgi:hypothetical protein